MHEGEGSCEARRGEVEGMEERKKKFKNNPTLKKKKEED